MSILLGLYGVFCTLDSIFFQFFFGGQLMNRYPLTTFFALIPHVSFHYQRQPSSFFLFLFFIESIYLSIFLGVNFQLKSLSYDTKQTLVSKRTVGRVRPFIFLGVNFFFLFLNLSIFLGIIHICLLIDYSHSFSLLFFLFNFHNAL